MATPISRRTALTGVLAATLGATACRTPRAETTRTSPSPTAPSTTAPSTTPIPSDPNSEAAIQQDVLAHLAAAGVIRPRVDVDAHGHGGAHVFIDGTVQTIHQLDRGMKVGYDTATEHRDYAVIATLTRPATGTVGARELQTFWDLDDDANIAPRPKQLRTFARVALALFPGARERASLHVGADMDGLSADALIVCAKTSTVSAAETYRRLRPSWHPPDGVTKAGFSVGRGGVFLSDDALDITKHRSARLPDGMLTAWTKRMRRIDDPQLTSLTRDDGNKVIRVQFTDTSRKGPSAVTLAKAMIDAHGDSPAFLEIQGTKGADRIVFESEFCQTPISKATRATYDYYAERHPRLAKRHHLHACR